MDTLLHAFVLFVVLMFCSFILSLAIDTQAAHCRMAYYIILLEQILLMSLRQTTDYGKGVVLLTAP